MRKYTNQPRPWMVLIQRPLAASPSGALGAEPQLQRRVLVEVGEFEQRPQGGVVLVGGDLAAGLGVIDRH